MTRKIFTSLLVVAATSLMSASAFASINSPADHEQGITYEECSAKCDQFVDAKACLEFRKANMICNKKKIRTRPVYTAKQLRNIKC